MAAVNINNLPCLVESDDYHEFDAMKTTFRKLGLELNVTELGCVAGSYVGLIYTPGPNNEKMISAARAVVQKCEDGESPFYSEALELDLKNLA